ncbi:MAG: T9SS type A sorting domain-containing protein [Chitinophagaceae bacterium]
MKNWLQCCKYITCTTMRYALVCFCLIVVLSSNRTMNKIGVPEQGPYHGSIIIKISQHSKIHRIKLYPNVTNEVLFFMAQGEQGKIYQLFVFDMDGKLVKQTQVNNRETTVLSAFEKGDYLIEIFSNDERIENGSISVK